MANMRSRELYLFNRNLLEWTFTLIQNYNCLIQMEIMAGSYNAKLMIMQYCYIKAQGHYFSFTRILYFALKFLNQRLKSTKGLKSETKKHHLKGI